MGSYPRTCFDRDRAVQADGTGSVWLLVLNLFHPLLFVPSIPRFIQHRTGGRRQHVVISECSVLTRLPCPDLRTNDHKFIRSQKPWKPVVTFLVDCHPERETVTGCDGQVDNLKTPSCTFSPFPHVLSWARKLTFGVADSVCASQLPQNSTSRSGRGPRARRDAKHRLTPSPSMPLSSC